MGEFPSFHFLSFFYHSFDFLVGFTNDVVMDRMVGSIYGNLVRKCLAIKNSERTETEIRELSNFLPEVGATLDKCWA